MARQFDNPLGTTIAIATLNVNKPNVLWVLHDDLRAIWSRPYAEHHTLTPRIDTLANESFVFNQAYCQIGVCAPSRASLLTGRRPDAIHSYSFDVNFRGKWRFGGRESFCKVPIPATFCSVP